jgi:hypothetical protein
VASGHSHNGAWRLGWRFSWWKLLSWLDSFSGRSRLLRKGPLDPGAKRTKITKALLPKPAERQTGYRELQLRLPAKAWNLIEPLLTFRVDATARESRKLTAEIRSHHGDVVFRQTAHQFVLQIVPAGRDRAAIALVEGAAALIDVFFQTVV